MNYRFHNYPDPFRLQPKGYQLAPPEVSPITNAHFVSAPQPFGEIMIQRLKLDRFRLWKFDLVINQKCELEVSPYKSRISLHLMLRNEITLPFEEEVTLHQGEMNLIYMRSIKYKLDFEPGTYTFIQIDYARRVFSKFEDEHKFLLKALRVASNSWGSLLNMQPVSIGKCDLELLQQIMNGYYTLGTSNLMAAADELLERFLNNIKLRHRVVVKNQGTS